MSGDNKVDKKTMAERIYKVGLLLRRKPVSFILEYITHEWGLKRSQAYNLMRAARKDWAKYFTNLKHAGRAYHVAKLRDLNDMAHSKKVVVGTVDNKQVIQVADLNLILEITKEEAKLMGIYPAEKHEETRKVIILGKKEKEDESKQTYL